MTTILAIDTVSDLCSATLWSQNDAFPTAYRESSEKRSHARLLAPFCKELMEETGVRPDGIALVAGPGSYTGLRIGASTAKGLAFAMDIPLLAISTLHYLAHAARSKVKSKICIALTPARQTEVFAAVFQMRDDELVRVCPDQSVAVSELLTLVADPTTSISYVSNSLTLLDATREIYPDIALHLVSHDARHLKDLLKNRMDDFRVQELHSFEPSYLKEFVAKKATRTIFERLPF